MKFSLYSWKINFCISRKIIGSYTLLHLFNNHRDSFLLIYCLLINFNRQSISFENDLKSTVISTKLIENQGYYDAILTYSSVANDLMSFFGVFAIRCQWHPFLVCQVWMKINYFAILSKQPNNQFVLICKYSKFKNKLY